MRSHDARREASHLTEQTETSDLQEVSSIALNAWHVHDIYFKMY